MPNTPRAPRAAPNVGLNGPVRTYKEVGDIMGVSLQRVQQIEARAFKKLRVSLARRLDIEHEQGPVE